MSQAGLQPIRAGRFTVHTPTYPPRRRRGSISRSTPSLAFGTGQHATTSGCLEALDRLERDGARFANIADIGTGTGLLAFAALALWPEAKCIATDIDPVAIDVARDNAAINRREARPWRGRAAARASPTAWIRRCSPRARRST